MVDVIAEKDRLQDYGFIDLSVKKTPKRVRSDPRDNNIKFELPEGYKVVLKAGKSLKDIVDIIEE
jgi:nucleoid DNA-binding protein